MGHVVQEEVWDPPMCKIESSNSDLVIQSGFVQLSQEASVFVQICSTDSEQLSRRLGDEIERDLLSLSA